MPSRDRWRRQAGERRQNLPRRQPYRNAFCHNFRRANCAAGGIAPLSLSRDVADRFRITLGVANLFDTPPPRVSTVVTATPPVIGQAPAFGTQYDYLGRRFFLAVRGKI